MWVLVPPQWTRCHRQARIRSSPWPLTAVWFSVKHSTGCIAVVHVGLLAACVAEEILNREAALCLLACVTSCLVGVQPERVFCV